MLVGCAPPQNIALVCSIALVILAGKIFTSDAAKHPPHHYQKNISLHSTFVFVQSKLPDVATSV